MTWIFLWDTAPSKIFVGDTQVSKVFVWDTQVRPTWWGGWQPWPNTIAYYPLTANANDTVNGNNMTADALITFSSDWAYFPSGTTRSFAWMLEPNTINITATWTWTIVWWQKTLGVIQGDARWLDLQYSSGSFNRIFTAWSNASYGFHDTSIWFGSMPQLTTNRYLNGITIDNGVVIAFANGNELTGATWTINTALSYSFIRWGQEWWMWANRALYWYLKDIIIEDKKWTATEMYNYFEQTKWNYWY